MNDPAHGDPSFVAALGQVVWGFLYLENRVERWLRLVAPVTAPAAPAGKTAFGKAAELRHVAANGFLPEALRCDVAEWASRYAEHESLARQAIMHARVTVQLDGSGEHVANTVSSTGDGDAPGLSEIDLVRIAARIRRLTDELEVLARRAAG